MDQNFMYGFGAFHLETNTQLLRDENGKTRLQPKIYRLLLYFLQHPGRLISRKELLDVVWQNRIVEDSALRLAINALRKALKDDSKKPRYILTVSRCGYCFLPEVTVESGFKGRTGIAKAASPQYQATTEFFNAEGYYGDELAQMLEAFEQAAGGNRRLVFLNGERSTGKTALIERFLSAINEPDLAVLRARCVQLGGASEPFLPLLEALERHCLKPGGQLLINTLHKIAPTWLYQMSNMLEPEQFATLYPKVSQISTGRMLREGANFFERLGTDSTFVLILDSSHWSDEFTLDLVCFLASRCSSTRLLMILSFRLCENCSGARRLEEMREELRHQRVCSELSLIREKKAVFYEEI